MSKLVQVKIVKIKYSGDSIGDDIKIEAHCLDKLVSLKKTIKPNSEVDLNMVVGSFFNETKVFNALLDLKIIEEDLVFNDVGNVQLKLKSDTSSNVVKIERCVLEITELRNFISSNKAVFEITVEISAMDAVMYIACNEKGWTNVLLEKTGEKAALPNYLKVRFDRNDGKRQYFDIVEGLLKNVKASVINGSDDQMYLTSENKQTKGVHLVYSISKKTLRLGNEIYKTVDDPDSPWKKGLYDLEIPDAPHSGGRYYPKANLAKVWFRIGHSGARYLHPGAHSLGCITFLEIERWDEFCEILLKARKGDDASVGYIEIIE